MNDAILTINGNIGMLAVKKSDTLEQKVKASMLAVLEGNWLTSEDELLFRCGIAGVLFAVGKDSEEYKISVKSVKALRSVSTMLELAQSGNHTMSLNPADFEEIVPLMAW